MNIICYCTDHHIKTRLQEINVLQKAIMMFIHIFNIFNLVHNLNLKFYSLKDLDFATLILAICGVPFITMLNIGDMSCLK